MQGYTTLTQLYCQIYINISTTIFDVLLTVHISIFILVINQLDAQNLFYNEFISCLYMFRAPFARRQEVKIVLYSLWYHHTYRWPSGAQVERGLVGMCKNLRPNPQSHAFHPVLSQPVHGTATNRCDDTKCCIIQF